MLKFVRVLFVINALVWLSFAFGMARRAGIADQEQAIGYTVVAVLLAGNAAAMLLAGWVLRWRSRLSFIFAAALLLVNLLLTFTDQVGLWDWLTAALDALMLALLWWTWRQARNDHFALVV
ncbi:MAG: hypothetical protein WAZ19_00310 [Anaerolineae bacterium]